MRKFDEVLALIEAARRRAYQAINTELVGLYWELGAYISKKIASAEWGDGVVDELAATIAGQYPGMRGYTRRNLFRMRQFFEVYRGQKKVSPLVTQLPWTHHLIILGQTKSTRCRSGTKTSPSTWCSSTAASRASSPSSSRSASSNPKTSGS
jgi:hypothetical protein